MRRCAGGLTTYKVIDRSFKFLNSDQTPIILNGTLKLDSVSLTTSANYPMKEHPILNYIFGMHKDVKFTNLNKPFQVINDPELGTTTLKSTNTHEGIIDTLNNSNPN